MGVRVACQAIGCRKEGIAQAYVGDREVDRLYFLPDVFGLVWVCEDHFPNEKSGNVIVDDLRERIEFIGMQRDGFRDALFTAQSRAKEVVQAKEVAEDRLLIAELALPHATAILCRQRDAAEARADKLRVALRGLVIDTDGTFVDMNEDYCFYCGVSKSRGHKPDCAVIKGREALAADMPTSTCTQTKYAVDTETNLCPDCGKGSYSTVPHSRRWVCTYRGADYL